MKIILFPGQGSQYPDMLRDLAIQFPSVRRDLASANAALSEAMPESLTGYVFPVTAYSDAERRSQREDAKRS